MTKGLKVTVNDASQTRIIGKPGEKTTPAAAETKGDKK